MNRAFRLFVCLFVAGTISTYANDAAGNEKNHEISTTLELSIDGLPQSDTGDAVNPPSLVFGSTDSSNKSVELAIEIKRLQAELDSLHLERNAAAEKIADLTRKVSAAKHEAEVRMNSQKMMADKLAKLDTEYKEFKEEHRKMKNEWFQLKYETPERKVSADEKALQELREEHEKTLKDLQKTRQRLQETNLSPTVMERKRCKEMSAELERVKKELNSLKEGKQ